MEEAIRETKEKLSQKVGIDFERHHIEARRQKAIANQLFLNAEVARAGSDISRKKKLVNIIRMPEGLLKDNAILAIKRGW